jgi:hypothetical protein
VYRGACRRLDEHPPLGQHAAVGLGQIGNQLVRQFVVQRSAWSDREPQQVGTIERTDTDNRSSRLQVLTATAVACGPNRQNQPRSPGCSWIFGRSVRTRSGAGSRSG